MKTDKGILKSCKQINNDIITRKVKINGGARNAKDEGLIFQGSQRTSGTFTNSHWKENYDCGVEQSVRDSFKSVQKKRRPRGKLQALYESEKVVRKLRVSAVEKQSRVIKFDQNRPSIHEYNTSDKWNSDNKVGLVVVKNGKPIVHECCIIY